MPHEFCLDLVPWHQLDTPRIEFGESPGNLVLPGGLNMLVDVVLKALQQQPSQDGSVLLIECGSLPKQRSHRR
jgi:hypothetical protein